MTTARKLTRGYHKGHPENQVAFREEEPGCHLNWHFRCRRLHPSPLQILRAHPSITFPTLSKRVNIKSLSSFTHYPAKGRRKEKIPCITSLSSPQTSSDISVLSDLAFIWRHCLALIKSSCEPLLLSGRERAFLVCWWTYIIFHAAPVWWVLGLAWKHHKCVQHNMLKQKYKFILFLLKNEEKHKWKLYSTSSLK